jgi:hypothetical protein
MGHIEKFKFQSVPDLICRHFCWQPRKTLLQLGSSRGRERERYQRLLLFDKHRELRESFHPCVTGSWKFGVARFLDLQRQQSVLEKPMDL